MMHSKAAPTPTPAPSAVMPAEPVNPRLSPHWTDGRYYGLRAVRALIENAVDSHVRALALKQRGAMPSAACLRAIDLGCGTAPYRSLLLPYVSAYLGADLAQNPSADLHIDPSTGHVDAPSGSADLVISTQVLEHVESPEQYLREAYRLCRPGGLLMLSTHGFWKYHPDPTDYWRWTASGLCKLIESVGWGVVDRSGALGFAAASACLFQDSIAGRLPKPLRKPFAIAMQRVVALLDKTYTPDQRRENAAVYLVIARKPESLAAAA